MVDISFYWEHGGLFQQLAAARRLPSGTELALPALAESRQLLAELMPLSNDVDPRVWLRQERPDLTAQLAIYYSLLELRSRVEGARRASLSSLDVSSEIPIVFNAEEPADELLRSISRDQLPSPEALASTLKLLRQSPGSEQDERTSLDMAFLAELLVPAPGRSGNPLAWTRAERFELAALIVLSHVLDEYCPPLRSRDIRPVVKVERPGAWLRPTDYFNLTVDEIVVGRDALIVRAMTRYVLKRLPTLIRPGYNARMSWQGFEDVVDDIGHVCWHRNTSGEGIDRLWQHGSRVTMVYVPSISPEARELRFTSSAGKARISQNRNPVPDGEDPGLVVEDVPDFPEVRWTYSFPM